MNIYLLQSKGTFQAFKTVKTLASVIGISRQALAKQLKSGFYAHNPTQSVIYVVSLTK
jgi:DNA-binding phage protein